MYAPLNVLATARRLLKLNSERECEKLNSIKLLILKLITFGSSHKSRAPGSDEPYCVVTDIYHMNIMVDESTRWQLTQQMDVVVHNTSKGECDGRVALVGTCSQLLPRLRMWYLSEINTL